MKDHLDKETSMGVELTPTGVSAKARSRFIAAIDRLCGNAVELLSTPMERRTNRDRAMIAAEETTIHAIVEYGVNRMKEDRVFADRVAQKHFEQLFERQGNKDGVVRHAIEDLRREAATSTQANDGPEKLSTQFIDRLERFAEEASTEELRERWGRVLSTEVRTPGIFSPKVLRIVDELDATTAQLFERVCESRLANVLPKCIVGQLSFNDVVRLTDAGLIVEPGMGQIRAFSSEHGSDDKDHWILYLGEFALAFLAGEIEIERLSPFPEPDQPLVADETKAPATPVYVLTDSGFAVSQILTSKRREAFQKFIDLFRQKFNISFDALEIDPVTQKYQSFGN